MSSQLQNRKVMLKFVNFHDDPCMIFRGETNFTLHLTARQETIQDIIDLVNFKFPALANKELIFRPSEGGRILTRRDPATLVWSQLVIEKCKPGQVPPPAPSSKKIVPKKQPVPPNRPLSRSPRRRSPEKCVRKVGSFGNNPMQRSSTQTLASSGKVSSVPKNSSSKPGQGSKKGSPPTKVSPTVSNSSSTGSKKILTCRKTSNKPHKRFDIELEDDDSPPKKPKTVQELLDEQSDEEKILKRSQQSSLSSSQGSRGPPPLKQLKQCSPKQRPDSPIRYFENDPENRSSNWSYMKLPDLVELPEKKDIVAFKMMILVARSETRSGQSDKVTKLSVFKEGKVLEVDVKYKMVTIELNESFDVPDDSIAGPGLCKVLTVDWTSIYFPKLVSRQIA